MKMRLLPFLVALVAWSLAGQSRESSRPTQPGKPSITITVVPPWDPGGPDKLGTIAGVVSAPEDNAKVVIFAHGDVWYVQPYVSSPYTSIGPRGQWRSQTHLGTEYAALLVRASYRPPATAGRLPAVGGDVLVVAVVEGKK